MASAVGGPSVGRGQVPNEPLTQDGQLPGVVQQGGPNGVRRQGLQGQHPGGQLPPGGQPPEGTPLPDGKAPAGFVKDKDGKIVPASTQDVPRALDGTPLQGTGQTQSTSRVATNPVFQNDQVEASTGDAPMTALSETPVLPGDEGIPGTETQGDFTAYVGFVDELGETLTQPGALTAIWARAGELQANPDQSITSDIMATEDGAAIGKSFADNFEKTITDIRDGIPEDLRPQFDEAVTGLKNMMATHGGVALFSVEAAADFMITACFKMNNQAARQMKSFIADVLRTMQKFDAGKRSEINAYQGQIASKLEGADRAKKAAEENKFWNCLLAVGLIIVALVCAVLSVFTFGAAAAGSVAAVLAAVAMVAAITMAVCVIIQNLPAILEACGADEAAASMRKLLSGPFGKVLLGIMIACAVLMLVCGIGGAIAAAASSAAAVPAAGTNVTITAAQTGATTTGTVGATTTNVATGVSTTVINGAAGQIGTITSSAGSITSVTTTGAAASSMSFAATGTSVFGQTMTTTVSLGANGAAAGATTAVAGTSSAIQTATAVTQVAGGATQVAKGCLAMSQAEIEYATAMLSAEVQELTVQIQRVKTELDLNRVYKGDWEESLKGLEQGASKMFQQAMQALNAQTEANQAVANLYR